MDPSSQEDTTQQGFEPIISRHAPSLSRYNDFATDILFLEPFRPLLGVHAAEKAVVFSSFFSQSNNVSNGKL